MGEQELHPQQQHRSESILSTPSLLDMCHPSTHPQHPLHPDPELPAFLGGSWWVQTWRSGEAEHCWAHRNLWVHHNAHWHLHPLCWGLGCPGRAMLILRGLPLVPKLPASSSTGEVPQDCPVPRRRAGCTGEAVTCVGPPVAGTGITGGTARHLETSCALEILGGRSCSSRGLLSSAFQFIARLTPFHPEQRSICKIPPLIWFNCQALMLLLRGPEDLLAEV